MTLQRKALGRIMLAQQRVREAADRWNAVDLSAICHCCSALERTVADLRDATEMLKRSPAEVTAAELTPAQQASTASRELFRSSLLDLKNAAVRLERLVDASAAFLRSAPGLAGEESGFYQAGGAICRMAPAPEARGMQV